ncbi:MAG: IS1595 family transposase [Bacteroidales bacterium]|jgi:transposase-like protein|nr:IS1595 family transposase [Bacteroidales bacterium]
MKTSKHSELVNLVNGLDNKRYHILKEAIEKRDSVKFVARLLNNNHKDVNCPHCKSDKLQKWGIRNDMQRYKCKECRRTFNVLTGTPLAKLRKKGRWLSYAECLKNGLTIREAAAKCGVHKNTSFRWRHRFLENSTEIKPDKLSGIVEVNEKVFAWSDKGSKKLNRNARKRGFKSHAQIPVNNRVFTLYCRDRSKNSYDKILSGFSADVLQNEICGLITNDTLFCSKNKQVYMKYTKQSKIRHGVLDISKREIVKRDVVHIQNVRLYIRKLEIWMERFHGVATKYLNNYLSWFRELDEFDYKISPETIMLRAMRPDRYNTNHYR